MTRSATLRIGTSGWSYPHWKGPFYPDRLPDSKLLAYYSQYFNSVEINNSFYHLPSAAALRSWHRNTPAGFQFAAKASRYITHMKKLREPKQSVGLFLERLRILGEKLGPIVFQLPPRWHFNAERLTGLLDILPDNMRYVFEFRDPDWINSDALAILRRYGAAFCIYELAGYRSPQHVTADFVYIRLHGPEGPYQGSYDGRTLAAWARRIDSWRSQGLDVYCYFDNDEAGYAVQNALDLQKRLA